MILKARWVVDRDLCLHERFSIDTGGSGETLDLGDVILLPGLVNAHCHLDYTDMRGLIPRTKSFLEWIYAISQLKRTWTEKDFAQSIQHGCKESLSFGTTTMANWICSPEVLDLIDSSPMRLWWLWEQIQFLSSKNLPDWSGWPERVVQKSKSWEAGLAPHAPYTCTEEVIRKTATWCGKNKKLFSCHVAESKDESAMFRKAEGMFFDQFKSLGRSMTDCGDRSPFQIVMSQMDGIKDLQALLIHANDLDAKDLEQIQSVIAQGAFLSIVHCPRSHEFFGHQRFPMEDLLSKRVCVCLGTDSLASNDDLSMFKEMNQCAATYPALDDRQIIQMATIHGAKALGCEKQWFQWQDWIAIPSASEDPWKAITHFTGKPCFVMVNGTILSLT